MQQNEIMLAADVVEILKFSEMEVEERRIEGVEEGTPDGDGHEYGFVDDHSRKDPEADEQRTNQIPVQEQAEELSDERKS